jgi:DNA-binding GntR family transcriptional regulator
MTLVKSAKCVAPFLPPKQLVLQGELCYNGKPCAQSQFGLARQIGPPGEIAMVTTNADLAYRLIKEKIITTEMPPGSLIQESRLMKELSLGRTPIREALRQLEAERLVVVIPRRGIFVADILITDLQQIYEVRVKLEPMGARLAAERATTEQIAEMDECCQHMVRPDSLDSQELILIDRQFHTLLAEATRNKLLAGEIELFYNLSLRLWHLALTRMQAQSLDTDRHQAILQAVKDRDGANAEMLMKQHIQRFQESIRAVL